MISLHEAARFRALSDLYGASRDEPHRRVIFPLGVDAAGNVVATDLSLKVLLTLGPSDVSALSAHLAANSLPSGGPRSRSRRSP